MTHAKPDDKRAEFITDQAIRDKQIDPTLAIPADRIDWMQRCSSKPASSRRPCRSAR